jgi:uncharacterized protein (TIGR02147 family)
MVLTYDDYKVFLRAQVSEARPTRGFMAKLAKAAGCQRSYLSQVLSSHVQLTPDQAFALARFFGLNSGESEYFRLLVDLERCATAELKADIKYRLEQIRHQQMKITNRITSQKTNGENYLTYYSSWIWSAIHYLASIPEMQTPEKISERLRLPLPTVVACLDKLVEMRFLIYEDKKYKHKGESLHLQSDSPLTVLHHNNWRQRALLDAQELGNNKSIHYSSVFTMSRKDFLLLHELTLQFLERGRQIISPSTEEALYCVTCDLFEV